MPQDQARGAVPAAPGRRRWRWALAVPVAAGALVTSGCSASQNDLVSRGWLPTATDTTGTTRMSQDLWVGSWVAALAIGVLVWGLILYCVVRYRRRKNDTGLPPQLRYNVPLEMLYTIVPLFMVGVLFFYTARDETAIEARAPQAPVKIGVIGKRWAWDFNYTGANVYEAGIMAAQTPTGLDLDAPNTIPTLYLPVGQTVEFTLQSRDVIHDFYVPAWSYKKDVVPGRTNYMTITPQREGVFIGRCAELCGEYHSRMLFKVAVVSQADYQAHLAQLRAEGHVGQLPVDLGPSKLNDNLREQPLGQTTGSATSGSQA